MSETSSATITVDDVVAAVTSGVYRYTDEVDLHRGLEQALRHHGIEFAGEVQISGGRIDFLIGRIGVEVKIKGPTLAVREQLTRYAAEERVDALLLLTTRPLHLDMPSTLNGKPVRAVLVGGGR